MLCLIVGAAVVQGKEMPLMLCAGSMTVDKQFLAVAAALQAGTTLVTRFKKARKPELLEIDARLSCR